MRVLMIAGEPSGDLHGSGVVRELKRRDPRCEVFGIGGDKMQAAGMELVYHIRELSVMGFWEVVQHLPLLRSVERTLEAIVKARKPEVVVLIDYPGFNLRFAKSVRGHDLKIVYYISPQVWAWNRGRVRKMKGLIDRMLVSFHLKWIFIARKGSTSNLSAIPSSKSLPNPREGRSSARDTASMIRSRSSDSSPGAASRRSNGFFP